MDKLEQIVANFLSSKFDEWKPYLNTDEQAVFILYYFKGYKTFQIAMEINYSERQIFRILKSARKKINKLLP
jgi:RNA polymerase sigma factor (sigma-70 family)